MPTHRELDRDFFKKWTSEMAYVLGYFAADGSMIRNTRGGRYVEFTTTDRQMLSAVRDATSAPQRIAVRPKRKARWKTQYRVQIGNNQWFKDLLALGFTPAKSKKMLFPNVPESVVSDFVRGYFDGDGCVYFNTLKYADRKKKRWVLMTLFTSGSRPFLESLWSILKQHSVTGGTIQPKKRGFELKFSHRDSLALYHFMYNTTHALDLYLPRKRKKLERAIKVLGLNK